MISFRKRVFANSIFFKLTKMSSSKNYYLNLRYSIFFVSQYLFNFDGEKTFDILRRSLSHNRNEKSRISIKIL